MCIYIYGYVAVLPGTSLVMSDMSSLAEHTKDFGINFTKKMAKQLSSKQTYQKTGQPMIFHADLLCSS